MNYKAKFKWLGVLRTLAGIVDRGRSVSGRKYLLKIIITGDIVLDDSVLEDKDRFFPKIFTKCFLT